MVIKESCHKTIKKMYTKMIANICEVNSSNIIAQRRTHSIYGCGFFPFFCAGVIINMVLPSGTRNKIRSHTPRSHISKPFIVSYLFPTAVGHFLFRIYLHSHRHPPTSPPLQNHSPGICFVRLPCWPLFLC